MNSFGAYTDARVSFDGDTVAILFARAVGGKITHIGQSISLRFAPHQKEDPVHPTLLLTRQLAQSLLDALWRNGLRPTLKPLNERDLVPGLVSALDAWIRTIAHGLSPDDVIGSRQAFTDRLHELMDDLCAGQKDE